MHAAAVDEANQECDQLRRQEASLREDLSRLAVKLEETLGQLQSTQQALLRCAQCRQSSFTEAKS